MQSGISLLGDQSPPPITFPALPVARPFLFLGKNFLSNFLLLFQHSLLMHYKDQILLVYHFFETFSGKIIFIAFIGSYANNRFYKFKIFTNLYYIEVPIEFTIIVSSGFL